MNKIENHRAPGSGSVSRNPSGTYRAQITIPSKTGNKAHRETQSFKTKREAENWLRKSISDVDAGLSAENHNITVGEYLEDWLLKKKLEVRPGTLDDYKSLCRLYIAPYIGNRAIRSVKTADINSFYVSLDDRGIGTPTIDYVHRVQRAMFSDAILEGVVSSNPCKYASHPRPNKSKNVKVMSQGDLVAFLELADKTAFWMLFRTALATGMRLGELLGLTWRDIDFSKGTINVNKQIPTRHIKGIPREVTETKSDAGVRILPIGSRLLENLHQYYRSQEEHIVFVGSSWKDQNLVFSSSIGTPLEAGRPEKACKKIYAAIGLDNSFTFHNLRHTAASIMMSNGMSLVEVSKYLGHSSPVITAQIYIHLIPGGLEKAIDVFDRVLPRKD